MKTNLLLFLCTWCLSIGSIMSQSVTFKFKIWKNTVSNANYLGEYTAYTHNNQYFDVTANLSGQLCPGDRLIVKNLSTIYTPNQGFSNLSFNGTTHKATIGLTPKKSCSIFPNNTVPLTHIADVCQGVSGCTTAPQSFNSWNYNNNITITIPPYTSSTSEIYLMFAYGIMGTPVSSCGCSDRYSFTKINLAPNAPPINDKNICPGTPISINPPSGFTYSNWNPNDPNINAPTTTTNYTVDVTHTNTGCTKNNTFTVKVNHPDVELLTIKELCYNESFVISKNDYNKLYSDNGFPEKIFVNGTLIAGGALGTSNLPHVIDAIHYGPGVVTIEYLYYSGSQGGYCTKTYTLTIHPQIPINVQSSYAICNNNFNMICAYNGFTQPGISYRWAFGNSNNIISTNPCIAPTAYGTYYLTAYDQFGCSVSRTINIYDPGVGIAHPGNITFCSIDNVLPSYVGWRFDPFEDVPYGFQWTHTSIDGAVTNIPNTGAFYQVPYLGPGTYTAHVIANGCTETFNITVTDLLQVHHNHPHANFNIASISANEVSCLPTSSVQGATDYWTVVNQSGTIISTTSHINGIKFQSTAGDYYTITLRREVPSRCEILIQQFGIQRREQISGGLNSAFDPVLQVFPNPTNGLVNLKLTDIKNNTTSIIVSNSLGQVILEKEVKEQNNIEIDLSKEINGVYSIQVINGDSKFTEKIIKQ